MGIIVDLPAPSGKGTYFALVEPEVVKIGTSNCIRNRLSSIRASTFRRVALLAWTDLSEQYVHELLIEARITLSRGFFRVTPELLLFINDCRVGLGYSSIEEILLWEFGGPLPYSGRATSTFNESSSSVSLSQVSPEDRSRMGRYYTHLRWHKNKPKPSCEFCAQIDSR
jgi:hypothetical protein